MVIWKKMNPEKSGRVKRCGLVRVRVKLEETHYEGGL